jgi:uncharacterized protein VirK/YbjX
MCANRIHQLAVTSQSELRHERFRNSRFPDSPGQPEERTVPATGSVLVFASDSYYWSPARILRTVWGITTAIPWQVEILRVMRSAPYAEYVKTDPRFRFKFLIRDYLVKGFSTAKRAACFLQHYKRLHSVMSSELLHRVLYQKAILFETHRDGMDIQISLCLSRPFEKEGELSLNFCVDGTVVFVLSFTIAPGWTVQCDADEVVLISRLQGTSGYYPQIRAATRAMHDIGPAALLLAALHGFANAFGIRSMAAVSAVRQSSFKEELGRFYRSAYDDFFSEMNIAKNAAGLFVGPLPPEDKPITSIKQGHKIRTREKRQFKRELAESISLVLQRELGTAKAKAPVEKELIAMVGVVES